MFLETETARINVEVAGPNSAPSIFFWNGAFCNLRQWDYLCEELKDDFRLIRFDIRGTGKSHAYVGEAFEFSLEQYAEDAVLILDTLGVEKCHVWSMAWGSRAAIAFCSIHPDRVLSAALFDASVEAADVERQKNGAREALAKQIAQGVPKFSKPLGYTDHEQPDQVPSAMAAAGRFDLEGGLDFINAPVLLATGDHDPNLDSTKKISERIINARLEILANVGHGSVLQRPDLCLTTWLTFFESYQSRSPR